MELTLSKKAVALAAGAAIAVSGAFAIAATAPQQAEAAAYKTAPLAIGRAGAYPWKVKVGKTTYSYTVQYNANGTAKKGTSVIKATKNSKTKILVKNAAVGCGFVTNGKYLYYLKQKVLKTNKAYRMATKSKFTLYRMTLKSKASKKLLTYTGFHASALTATGNYVYYGAQKSTTSINRLVYVYNVKTKKTKSLGSGLDNNFARVVGNRVVVGGSFGAGTTRGLFPLYSFALDGSNKAKIANTYYWSWNVKGNKVRYSVVRNYSNSIKSVSAAQKWSKGKNWKVYQCTNLGKNKKAITGWVTEAKVEKMFNNR